MVGEWRLISEKAVRGARLALGATGGRIGRYRIVLRTLDDSSLALRRWDPVRRSTATSSATPSAAGPSARRRSRGRSSAGKSFIRGDRGRRTASGGCPRGGARGEDIIEVPSATGLPPSEQAGYVGGGEDDKPSRSASPHPLYRVDRRGQSIRNTNAATSIPRMIARFNRTASPSVRVRTCRLITNGWTWPMPGGIRPTLIERPSHAR